MKGIVNFLYMKLKKHMMRHISNTESQKQKKYTIDQTSTLSKKSKSNC